MSIERTRLDPFSQAVLGFIADHRPDWLNHIRPVSRTGFSEHFIEVALPDPDGTLRDNSLVISTDGEELTLIYEPHHTHVARTEPEEDGLAEAVAQADALAAEQVVVVSIWKGDRLRVSLFEDVANLPRYQARPGGDHVLRIRSWRGTYDAAASVGWADVRAAWRPRTPA